MNTFSGYGGFVSDRNGRSGSAIYLSGGYATIPSAGCPAVQNVMSTTAWIYITSFSGCSGIFNLNSYNFDWFYCAGTQRLYLQTGGAYYSSYVLSTYSWTHLGMVITTGYTYVTFYVNGAFDSTSSMSSVANAGSTCYLSYPSFPYYGYIDDMMFFSTSLSASQMLAVKNYYY